MSSSLKVTTIDIPARDPRAIGAYALLDLNRDQIRDIATYLDMANEDPGAGPPAEVGAFLVDIQDEIDGVLDKFLVTAADGRDVLPDIDTAWADFSAVCVDPAAAWQLGRMIALSELAATLSLVRACSPRPWQQYDLALRLLHDRRLEIRNEFQDAMKLTLRSEEALRGLPSPNEIELLADGSGGLIFRMHYVNRKNAEARGAAAG